MQKAEVEGTQIQVSTWGILGRVHGSCYARFKLHCEPIQTLLFAGGSSGEPDKTGCISCRFL